MLAGVWPPNGPCLCLCIKDTGPVTSTGPDGSCSFSPCHVHLLQVLRFQRPSSSLSMHTDVFRTVSVPLPSELLFERMSYGYTDILSS